MRCARVAAGHGRGGLAGGRVVGFGRGSGVPGTNVPHRSGPTARVTPSTSGSRSCEQRPQALHLARDAAGWREGLGVVAEDGPPVTGRGEHPAVVVVERQEQRGCVAVGAAPGSRCRASGRPRGRPGRAGHRGPGRYRVAGHRRPAGARRWTRRQRPSSPRPCAGANTTPSTSISHDRSPAVHCEHRLPLGDRHRQLVGQDRPDTRAAATVGSCSMAASMLRVEMTTVAGWTSPSRRICRRTAAGSV